MNSFDPSLFPDIADALGLDSPAFVEKDYYAIQLLKMIAGISSQDWKLSFAGGTCLTKIHLPTQRMSEDLDIKVLPSSNTPAQSNAQRKKLRKDFKATIIKLINQTDIFSIVKEKSKNENAYNCLFVSYPKNHKHDVLRPELKLEFTEVQTHVLPLISSSIRSMYAQETKQADEISIFPCDGLEIILTEKFLSLLRRTAEIDRRGSPDDETLIRHVYDLFLIQTEGFNVERVRKIFDSVVKIDQLQFGQRHKKFADAPYAELRYGLEILSNNKLHEERYEKFLGPLVYNANSPSWAESIRSLENLANLLLQQTA